MTRAVFLAHTAAPSGAELATMRLIAALRACSDVDASIVVTEPGPMVATMRARGIPVTVYDNDFDSRSMTLSGAGSGPLPVLRGAARLARLGLRLGAEIRAAEADVLVAVSVKALLIGAVAARRARVPLVWQVHDRVSAEYFGRFLATAIRLLCLLCCAGAIANSRATAASLGLRRVPTVVAYPGVEFGADRPRAGQRPAAEAVVALVGRLTPWKGQDVALRALAATAVPPRRVLVVGGTFFGEEPYRARLEALAAELALPATFTGHVDDPAPHLDDADVLVHCSVVTEPFGQVVVEGMAAGCAVIAADAGGPAEIVRDGVDGLLVTPAVAPLTAALDRLLADPRLRGALGAAARDRARAFDVTESARVVAGFLTAIAGRERVPR
ncbi:glycosyltransferase family 4 protein [Nocardia thailandica]|uniref:glycosyltransferase family 4 protein n=1 Tax=Nocardia thailandica TaxID=257275 RepID=UPI0002DC011E|nr:glycosyltransferase family 4 protein [Nocardia thailandica]